MRKSNQKNVLYQHKALINITGISVLIVVLMWNPSALKSHASLQTNNGTPNYFQWVIPHQLSRVFSPASQSLNTSPLVASEPALDPSLGKAKTTVLKPHFPQQFKPVWQPLALDQGHLQLSVLKNTLPLTLSEKQLGSEYFNYSGFLFEQMAQQVDNQTLSLALADLASQAIELGGLIHQAGETEFNGTPSGFEHLQARADILASLNPVNAKAIKRLDYNASGHLMTTQANHPTTQAGPLLQQFLNTAQQVETSAHSYPQLKWMVHQQVQSLHQLAMGLKLHWESHFDCHSSQMSTCQGSLTQVQIKLIQEAASPRFAAIPQTRLVAQAFTNNKG